MRTDRKDVRGVAGVAAATSFFLYVYTYYIYKTIVIKISVLLAIWTSGHLDF